MYFLEFFSIQATFFRLWGYDISYIEFIGTLAGLVSVWLATRANILTWPTGIVNQLAFFLLFYQVQLYSDMLLQVYFTYVCIYGWIYWRRKENISHNISLLNNRNRMIIAGAIILSVVLLGSISINLPVYFPKIFAKPPAYPYTDAFISVLSIFACFLMARKKVESWLLWTITDAVSIYIYMAKGTIFIALEYVIFLAMAVYGLYNWFTAYRYANRISIG